MTATLEDALILAAEKHRGQRDKAGAPYILHPLRVMHRLGRDRPTRSGSRPCCMTSWRIPTPRWTTCADGASPSP